MNPSKYPSVSVVVPGKIMIAGEYSVLRGKHALALAVDKFFRIEAEPNPEDSFIIESSYYKRQKGLNTTNFEDVKLISKKSPHLLHAIERGTETFNSPFLKIKINSEYPPHWGFGSSSALIMGLLSIQKELGNCNQQINCSTMATNLQKDIQGFASGYDCATQSAGGLVLFQDGKFEKLDLAGEKLPFTIFVSKASQPTADIGQRTKHWLGRRHLTKELDILNERIIQYFQDYIKHHDQASRSKLFSNIKLQQRMLMDSPASCSLVRELIRDPAYGVDWVVKSTGAGGDDCALFFGDIPENIQQKITSLGWSKLDGSICNQGMSTTIH